jgi:nucleoid DNA-binding protein
MDITAFIRELLFSHDCVIVPGFGGFIGNYTPASIDKSTSTFYPPVKQISFNRNLNHNDGLLVGRISESAEVNYGDARNLVEEFASSLRNRLGKGEKVTFDHLGSFTNNQEGNIQFEPDKTVNYHLNSYGLESFQFLPLEGYDVRKQIAKHIDKAPVSRSSMRKILWRAAIIIPLLSIMVVIPLKTNLFKSNVEATSMNPLATAEFENNRKAVDQTLPVIDAGTEKAAIQAPPAGKNPDIVQQPSETILPAEKNSDNYCLITGSFKSKENAETQAALLKKEGFEAEIIDAPNGFFRVSAMRCSDINLALSKKDSIGKKFPGTWVKKI